MRLIERITSKFNKPIANRNLYYGYIYLHTTNTSEVNASPITQISVANYDNFAIMQKLTKRERDSYLKSKFNTFIDSEKSELDKYLAIKNNNIEYYRVPSLNNIVIPQIKYTTESSLLGDGLLTIQTYPLCYDFSIANKYLTLEQIKEYEKQLNQNKQSTYYHTNNEIDNDLREYYEW